MEYLKVEMGITFYLYIVYLLGVILKCSFKKKRKTGKKRACSHIDVYNGEPLIFTNLEFSSRQPSLDKHKQTLTDSDNRSEVPFPSIYTSWLLLNSSFSVKTLTAL